MLQGFRQLCLALRGIGWNLGKQNVDPLATRIFLHTQAESTTLRPARGHAFPFLMGFVRCALWQLGLAGGAELLYPDLLGIRELFYFLKRRSKLKGRAVAVDLAQQRCFACCSGASGAAPQAVSASSSAPVSKRAVSLASFFIRVILRSLL